VTPSPFISEHFMAHAEILATAADARFLCGWLAMMRVMLTDPG
jgi:hypothetical protein